MTAPTLSVVVAVKGAAGNLPDILARLHGAARPNTEVLFVTAGDPPQSLQAINGARIIRSDAGALVPELWRDGIVQAQSARVALIASHCIPEPRWLERAENEDLAGDDAGVGGAIVLAPGADAVQKAIYLQRYSNYAGRRRGGPATDIAADNAVYRRDAIIRHADLLTSGFWEPSFHRRFAREGLGLRFDPELCVAFRGDDAPLRFLHARYTHGREYGRSRANASGFLHRVGLLVVSPLIAPLLVARVVSRAASDSALRGALFNALPWLIVFAVGWSAGEARGYLGALFGSRDSRG